MSRFLDNPAIEIGKWYEPIARKWLERQAQALHQIILMVDGTKVDYAHQLLMVNLAYRKRAIPIAWIWVDPIRGHSTAKTHLALSSNVYRLLPRGIAVLLVGDSEFGSVEVLRQLDSWHWDYVLRQKTSVHVCLKGRMVWNDFGSWVQKPGQSIWLGKGYLSEKNIYPVNLLIHWKIGEEQPWRLATNLPDRQIALHAYARRMRIEEMFGDMKRHGFDLERTMLGIPSVCRA